MATCQICGRTIKANTGVIAHHGYERPQGWHAQTSSCFGARYKPYEESCDRIPAAIESVEGFITNCTNALQQLVSEPPDTLTYVRGGFKTREFTLEKPVNFDPTSDWKSDHSGTYECEFDNKRRKLQSSIRSAKVDLKYLQERLANWVAPIVA